MPIHVPAASYSTSIVASLMIVNIEKIVAWTWWNSLPLAFGIGLHWYGTEGGGLRRATTMAFMTLALAQ